MNKIKKDTYRKETDEYSLMQIKSGDVVKIKDKCTIPIAFTKDECIDFVKFLKSKQYLIDFEYELATFISLYLYGKETEFMNHNDSKNRFFYDINGIFHIYINNNYFSIRMHKRSAKLLKLLYQRISRKKDLSDYIFYKYRTPLKNGVVLDFSKVNQEDIPLFEKAIKRQVGTNFKTLLNAFACYVLKLRKEDYYVYFDTKNKEFVLTGKLVKSFRAYIRISYEINNLMKNWCEYTNNILGTMAHKEIKDVSKLADLGIYIDLEKEKEIAKIHQIILQL